ncbi:speckle-type POZ protein-like [Aedes albopictus]|uniref:BTB domain-containing protein n=1 Tax=Aedes albopictus TaxID=7160 RepID=A0ABM1Y6X1_AEDAL
MLGNSWKLCLHLWIDHTGFRRYVDAFLRVSDFKDQAKLNSNHLRYFIYALGNANRKVYSWASVALKYSPGGWRGHRDGSVEPYSFLKNEEVFPGGILTLRCEIISGENEYNALPEYQLHNQLRMLTDEKYTDVTVVVGERQIRAHKVMLAAHSPVFEAMFRADMQESSQNVIKIDDFDFEVVREMLIYIYSYSSPNIENLAGSLLRAADKYDLGRLKALCEQTLSAKVTVDTAVEYQALAALCSAASLQRSVAKFIADNIAEVLKTDEWKLMVQGHSLSYVLQKNKQNVEHNDEEYHLSNKLKPA